FACEHDETITPRAQPNACRHSLLDLPALVSFPWHLSPIAVNYDCRYLKCPNRNEQLRHDLTANASVAACSAFQWIWSTAGENADSIDSNVCDGIGRDRKATLRPG